MAGSGTFVLAALIGSVNVGADPGDESGAVVIVLPMEASGDAAPSAVEAIDQRMRVGLQRAGASVPAANTVQTCDNQGCPPDVIESTGATHQLRSQLVVDGRDYELNLELVRVGDEAEPYAVSETCEICGLEAVAAIAEGRVSALGPMLALMGPDDGRLEVTSIPGGARVLVDGDAVGVTPLELSIDPGQHVVELEKPGYFARAQRVEIRPGLEKNLKFELQEELPTAPRPPSWRWGWGTLAAGVVVAGASTPLFLLEGRSVHRNCTGNNIDVNGLCRYQHQTRAGGIAMVTAGASLAMLGTGLLIHAVTKNERDRRAHVRPAGLGVEGRF